MEDLKIRAKKLGLWNLWLSGGQFQYPAGGHGKGLSNLEVGLTPCNQALLMAVRHHGGDHGPFSGDRPAGDELLRPGHWKYGLARSRDSALKLTP